MVEAITLLRSEFLGELDDFMTWYAVARLIFGYNQRIRIPERFVRSRAQSSIETDIGKIKAAVQAQIVLEEG
jgi:hypothetical protein